MRWLIVGPYPPHPGAAASAAAEVARHLLAEGHDVTAVTGRPSAAHRHQPLHGARALASLARFAREQRVDAVRLHLTPGVVVPLGRGRVAAAAEQAGLLALTRGRRVEVVVDPAVDLRQWGGRRLALLLGRAARVEVSDDEARDAAVTLGADPGNVAIVSVRPAAPVSEQDGRGGSGGPGGPGGDAGARPPGAGHFDLPDDAAPDAIQEAVRQRAADLRAASGGGEPGQVVLTAPLRRLRPLNPPATTAEQWSKALARRVVLRLTAWQVDHIVQHVNRLHAATLEALEDVEEREAARAPDPPPSG